MEIWTSTSRETHYRILLLAPFGPGTMSQAVLSTKFPNTVGYVILAACLNYALLGGASFFISKIILLVGGKMDCPRYVCQLVAVSY